MGTRAVKYDCGVPLEYCGGAVTINNRGMSNYRTHASKQEAKKCGNRYLKKVGNPSLLPPSIQAVKPGKEGRVMVPTFRG